MKKRYFLLAVSVGLLALLVYYSNPVKVFKALTQANPIWVGAALGVWTLSALVRTLRWHYLLKKIDIDISFLSSFKIYVSGLFISNLTPAKSGDPARAALLKRTEKQSFSKGISSIFIERVLDIVVLISISSIGLFFLAISSISVWWVYLSIGIYSVIFGLGVYILISKERTHKIIGKLVSIFSFIDRVKELEDRVEEFSEKVSRSLKRYGDRKILVLGMTLTVTVWIVNAAVIHLAFRSVNLVLPFHIILVVMSATLLLSILTFLPGALGSGDIIAVTLYSGFLNAPLSLLTSGKLLSRLVNFWMYAVIGGLFLLIFFKKELEV